MLSIARRSPLKCSFCGRTASKVARLLGGPRVHICDGCVAACNKILEATPADFAGGWDKMTDAQLLSGLNIAEATVEATRAVLQAQITELRRRRVSWEAIGKALGISRQAAWERFS
ncbi:MAG: ClpX C4-type zinc finger protein [Rhodomicrobium sp.]